MFFLTITRFIEQLRIVADPGRILKASPDQGTRMVRRARLEVALQVAITLFCCVLAGYIIVKGGHGQAVEQLACGWIGAVLGYWLR